MFKTVKFHSDHLIPLLAQGMNEPLRDWFVSGRAQILELHSESITIMWNDIPMVCSGVSEYWPGRGQLWAVLNEESKRNAAGTFRIYRKWIVSDLLKKYHRIEMSVDYGFDQGKRRAKMLGFTLECERAKKYLPDGGDCSLYSIVRDE